MHLIDDIHLILSFRRGKGNLIHDLSDIINAVVGCCIDLDHIHACTGRDRPAHPACPARITVLRIFTVYGFCQNFCDRCLTGTARSAEQIGMSDSVCFYLILQCCYNMFLSFDIRKIVRTELSV